MGHKSEVAIIKTLACREDTEKKKKKKTKALISILGHYTIV